MKGFLFLKVSTNASTSELISKLNIDFSLLYFFNRFSLNAVQTGLNASDLSVLRICSASSLTFLILSSRFILLARSFPFASEVYPRFPLIKSMISVWNDMRVFTAASMAGDGKTE